MPWNIDHNSSILTLSQTVLEEEKDITKNHLFHLGRRLGITSILLFLPLESFDTAYKLIDNLVVALRSDFCTKEDQSWWKRLILVMNYASEDNEYTYLRSRFFDTFIPQLQQHYKLDHPISVVFISTRIYNSIQETEHRQLYKVYSQRILWQMMEDHMYSGRWCETSIANNMDNDDYVDDYESEEEEELYKTVTVVQNGVVQKNIHPENTHTPVTHYSSPVGTAVQRRATQRYQRLNTDESASALPVIVKRPF
ncbi:hypothetical protein BDB01DRAFT_190647 [Pilobolus umbonatus]|nr:hypothetical protein BDB01DRAFT_190647 [Pilobolus umbonatus]